MKKESVAASKKTKIKTISKPNNVINLGKEFPILSAINNHEYQRFLKTAYSANERDE